MRGMGKLRRVGLAPGILLDEPQPLAAQMQLMHYRKDSADGVLPASIQAAQALIAASKEGVTWLHIQGLPDKTVLEDMGARFGLHHLLLEDIQSRDQRPKLEEYIEHIFVVLVVPRWQDGEVVLEQMSLLLSENYVLSIHDSCHDITGILRERLAQPSSRLRIHSADFLFYTLMDLIIDQIYPLLERFGTTIDALEERLVVKPDRNALPDIQQAKRTLNRLRRELWPTREVISHLIRGVQNEPLLEAGLKPYLNDLYDHTISIMDMLETYRDTVAGLIDIHLSSVSNRLNEIMRTLTVISTLFIPLTFISGVYGMNFGSSSDSPFAMPELRMYFGYPIILGLMLSVAVGMLFFFKRKGWIFTQDRPKPPSDGAPR